MDRKSSKQAFAKIATPRAFKHKVKGIPHNSFLVAAGFNPEQFGKAESIDQEIVLLRVLEPVSLPQDNDYIRARIEHHQRRTSGEKYPVEANDGHDPISADQLQSGGLKCSVLGTFYVDENSNLRLGSDIENFMALSRLRVFKPQADSLAAIVNHVNPEVRAKAQEEAIKAGFKSAPSPIHIGTVRFTSTARMHRSPGEILVPVLIQPTDFLARRTTVLGMTRTGKSNTVKTNVSAVALAAMKDGIKVGQLIFDINGEYANANHQDDGSSIADVFPSQTIRYRAIKTDGFEDLRGNFYIDCDQALNLIQSLFKSEKSPFSGQDLDAFLASTLEEPDINDRSEHTRWRRYKSVFQCLLYRAGYPEPQNFKVEIPVANNFIVQIKKYLKSKGQSEEIPYPFEVNKDSEGKDIYASKVSLPEACAWFEYIRQINLAIKEGQSTLNQPAIGIESSTKGNSWVDPTLEA